MIVKVGVEGFYNGEAMRETHRHGSNCALEIEWWGEGDDDEKGIGGVDEVNESDASVVFDGD